MKTLQKFEAFEGTKKDPEVLQQIKEFQSNPKKYLFDPKLLNQMSEEELYKVAENYLDFPFRLISRDDDFFKPKTKETTVSPLV